MTVRLPDVNVLVHAVNRASPVHEKAIRWLREATETGGGLALAWVALLGFVRISTRPGIYAEPLSTDRALAIVDRWLTADAARVVHPGPRHAILLGHFLRRAGTAGNLTTDAHLAALAMEHGAVIGTFDRDFVRFDGLRVDRLTPE
jgi:toxin-antitoxin system PIN domain toxin